MFRSMLTVGEDRAREGGEKGRGKAEAEFHKWLVQS